MKPLSQKGFAWFALTMLWLCCLVLPAKNILILYDGKKGESEGFISSSYLLNLLGHFQPHTILHEWVGDYKPGVARKMDLVFVFFEDIKSTVPGWLLRDLSKMTGDIVWLNLHVQRFLNVRPGKYGFSCRNLLRRNDWRIEYRGEDFPKEEPSLNLVEVMRPSDVRVFARVSAGGGAKIPYFVRSKNLWYVADSPFSFADESGRFLILADLLHDILREPHPYTRRALIRLEDINAWDDPGSIRDVADYLARRQVPFQMAVIPIFRDPGQQVEIYLHEKPEIVSAIRYAVSRGGAAVMHGVSHQYRGQSGDDYEFWDDVSGKTIIGESGDWIDQRIKAGLNELFLCGIFPLAWETPHYSASQSVYHSIAKYFDTFYDRVMVSESEETQQLFPFPVRHLRIGVNIIPENLGFIDITKPDPEQMLVFARRLRVVRDGTASFFFHPFMPIKYLKTVVKGLQGMGWTFVSLRDFPCNVRTDSQWVTSSGGGGKIELANQYLHQVFVSRQGKRIEESYSPKRQTQVVEKKVSVSRGNMYAMEAIDLLPEKPRAGFWTRAREWVASLFHKSAPRYPLRICRTLIVKVKTASVEEENDQSSFEFVLRMFGFNPQIWQLATQKKFSIAGYDMIVVPHAAAQTLMTIETNTLLDFVERGGVLVTDGRTPLSEKLGLRFENRMVTVSEVRELSLPVANYRWAEPGWMAPFSTVQVTELAKVSGSERPLAVYKPFGRGKILFLGTLFDPHTVFGISRFPYFPYYLKNFLDVSFTSRRNNLEFYFDPGMRQNTSWEKLVKRWKKSGVRLVYLAAWHFWAKYNFDYRYFIDLCHGQGIAVYAWFEIPHVTPQMWEEHPEWREISADGSDAPVSWRRMINLQNPDARRAVKEFLWKLLNDYDWDGVNLAELSYDTREGFRNPVKFVPMNEQVRSAFRKSEKFDPRLIFTPSSAYYWERNPRARQKFLDFRADLVKEMHLFFLEEVEKIRKEKKKEIEVIVTVLDSLHHPEIIEEAGVRTPDIIGLMDRFDFTLQVEDPSRSWADSPDRYWKYFQTYRQTVRDLNRLMFDINVVDRGDVRDHHLPSSFAVGTELAATLYYASAPCGRTGIYCESTVQPFDMDILPFVLGSDAEVKAEPGGFSIMAKNPLTLSLNDPSYTPLLDGEKWPFYGARGISIPSGMHHLRLNKSKLLDFPDLQTSITFDGDIYDLSLTGNAYSFRYNSPIPVSLNFSRSLESVRVDGVSLHPEAQRNAIIMPRGRHDVEVYTESPQVYAVDLFGYLSANLFYILGSLSVGFLVLLYLYSRMKR